MIFYEKMADYLLETAIATCRVIDKKNHEMQCPACKNMIQFPIIARKEDRDNVIILLKAMFSYMKNDEIRKLVICNFRKDLQNLMEKYKS